VITKTFSKSES